MTEKIFIVEDNAAIVQGLNTAFKLNGFDCRHAPTLREARKLLAEYSPSLIVLDVSLPDGNGLEFCEEVRKANNPVPILFLTARQDEDTAVKSFAVGGCDFVRKPYSVVELTARIRRLLLRPVRSLRLYEYGSLTLDVVAKKANFEGKDLPLSPKEFDVLAVLIRAKGETVTREQILSAIDESAQILDRTLDSHVSHLRSKLKRLTDDKVRVVTEHRIGYRLAA